MARKSLFELINNASKEEHDYASEFLTDLTFSIEKYDKIHEHASSNTISPSSMKCERGMVYKLIGTEKDKEKRSYQIIDICQSGSQRHEAIQQSICNMKEIGLDCEYVNVKDYVEEHNLPLRIGKEGTFETHLYSDKHRASFLCDGIIKYKGIYYILEIKTESSGKFLKQKDVMEKHKNQAIAYSLFLGIPSIMFLYENRDILSKKTFIYTPTKKEKKELEEKIFRCLQNASNNVIPEKPKEYGRDLCQYCPYKNRCENE